jgi:hypothetical protein
MKLRIFAALIALCTIAAAPGLIGKFRAVTFVDTTMLATNGELIKRIFSPFASADLARKNDTQALDALPVDPKKERFGLYIPAQKPAKGYALIVWVSPLDSAGMPLGWPPILEDKGVIFVTAARSGNETSPLGRRIPLALIATANVLRHYPIDPDRVWIAGFSGGSRIAERMALAYPDVFSGAILDGSSDVVGSTDLPLPPRQNFERFLDRMAIAFSTGAVDDYNTDDAKRVVASLRQYCFDRLSVEVRPHEAHEMMNGKSLATSIEFLDNRGANPLPRNRQCREQLYTKIDSELARAEALARRRDRAALGAIEAIDRRYGSLAAPRSIELRARLRD